MWKTANLIRDLGGTAEVRAFGNVGNTVRMRNQILNYAMLTNATDVLMVDTDVSFDPRAAITILVADADVIGVPARMRTVPPEGYLPFAIRDGKDGLTIRGDGLMEVEGVGTSFLRVTRAAIERLIDAHPELRYAERINDPNDAEKYLHLFFNYSVQNGRFVSEDYHFCNLYRAAGGTVYAMPHLEVTHNVSQSLSGSLLEYFRETGMVERGDHELQPR